MIHRLFVVSFFLLPAGAALLAGRVALPVLVPVTAAVALAVFLLHRRSILGASGDRGGRRDWWEDGIAPYGRIEARMLELQQELQDSSLRVVNTNIQLLSVRELWQALAQPGRIEHVVDGALSYCHRGSAFQEVLILRIEPRIQELVARWLHPGANGTVMESMRWSLRGVGGTVGRVLRSPRSVQADDARRQPLITINGEVPDSLAEHGAYLAVPLLTPLPRQECLDGGWLYHSDCPAFTPANLSDSRCATASRDDGLDLSPCVSCRHFPIYGLMVVTDRDRDRPIRKADQLTLESLSYAVSAVLQNNSLYGDVKAAERFRDQILDGMTNGVITTDDRGRIVFSNRQAQQLLGTSRDRLRGRRLERLLDIPTGESPVRRALIQGEASLRREVYLRHFGGDDAVPIPVLVNISPFRPEEGGARGAIMVFEDLSGVQAMQEEIRHLDTLAAIGRFASSMAHEIRNPLGGISAGIDYLDRSSSLDEDDHKNINVIQQDIERLDRIIRNLFSVARPAQLQLEGCEASQLVGRAIRSLEEWARKQEVEILLQARGELPGFHVDRDLIHQVLINLLKNAVEASPAKATVQVSIDSVERDGVEDPSLPAGMEEGIVIEVVDHGPGIPADELGSVFEPFFSKKSEGTGLGLFVCHNIAERHGGQIQVRSRPGEGACFRLCLPLVPALIGGRS